MNWFTLSRLAASCGKNTASKSCLRVVIVRSYAARKPKGKKSKSSSVTLDYDLAEGLVNLEKLKNHMQSTLGKLQTELKDKLNVKIQPHALDRIKVESENGKEMLFLSEIAKISFNNSNMFVVDMSNSPQLTGHATKAIKAWSPNFEPTASSHLISVPVPRVTQEYRENVAKMAKAAVEQSKQNLRKVRQKGMSDIRKNKKGKSEDDVKVVEKIVQQLTNQFSEDADLLFEEKSKELLRI